MQRLFGTFPNRGAGLALLILRLAVAAALVSGAGLCPGPKTEVLVALSRVAAVLIVVGWYTPLAAGVGGADFSVHLMGLPRTWDKCPDDRYTGRHRSARGRRLFGGCKALWKTQAGGRAPAR